MTGCVVCAKYTYRLGYSVSAVRINNPHKFFVFSYCDVDDDIPNKDRNVDLKFEIPILLWVKIVHLFGKIRDRLNTAGVFFTEIWIF